MNHSGYSPKIFIGRDRELKILKRWLQEAHHPWFITVTGDGGIGKSHLIERFANEERNNSGDAAITTDLIDLYWTAHKTEIGILRNIAYQLRFAANFTSFHALIGKSSQYRDISDEIREAFLDGYKQLGNKRTLLIFDTIEAASDSAIRFFRHTSPQLKSLNPGTRLLAAGRRLPSDLASCNFIREIKLRGLTAEDFSKYLGEVVPPNRMVPLDVVHRVHAITQGRPLWSGLFADWVNAGNSPTDINTKSFEEFRQSVLQPVIKLSTPEDMILLAMAHLNRRSNENILSYVLSDVLENLEVDIAELIKNLARFSFVKYREPVGNDLGSCLLHDEMRDLAHDYFWVLMDPSGRYRKKWSLKAVTYYDAEIKRVESELPVNALDLQDLNAERLYYLFDVNPNEAFDSYARLYQRAKSTDIREELNAEVCQAQNAYGFQLPSSLQQQYLLRLAQVDHQRERYRKAIEKLRELEKDEMCDYELRANARWRLVMALTLNGEVTKAIKQGIKWKTWLKKTIRNAAGDGVNKGLVRQLAALHSQLGQAYRKQGNPTLAVKNYNEALKLYYQSDPPRDEVANVRTNLAGAFLELGFPVKALEQIRAAYRAYSALGDPYHLGRVHNVWGLIYDGILHEQEAREEFDKAQQYFEESKNKRGLGMCQTAQARMLRRELNYNKRYKKVIPTKDESERIYRKVGELIDAAILNLKGGDLALLAIALNEKGTLLRELKHFDEAIELFKESNQIAARINNKHRMADNLQDMSQTYYEKGEFDAAVTAANEAIAYGYPQPSGRARRTIANVLFHGGDHDGAFKAICLSCTEIVQVDTGSLSDSPDRKDRLYKEWIDWVIELLSKVHPLEQRELRIRQLIDCWNKGSIDGEPLSVIHPDFISALENLAFDDNHTQGQ